MPKKDGTGPTGKGPMTGRGSGYCIIPLDSTQEELNYLKNREKALNEELQNIEHRLSGQKATTCRRVK
jgi:hypothetical protein